MKTITRLLFATLAFIQATYAVDYSNPAKYGNKTANLARIQTLVEDLREKDNVPVRMPLFMGIAHEEVKEHLMKTGNYEEVERIWTEFKTHQEKQNELTDQGKADLAAIRKAIRDGMLSDFKLYDKDRDTEFEIFLTHAQKDALRLMVRSTGREDSKELANAGGNESIANVSPDAKNVAKAMVKVLESYFGEKSFKQRIAGGEDPKTLFGEPFLPVLLQVMVGEKDEKIPTSGVVFSRETLGNTPGVISIDATFGHGEAVVNSLYPADTFYVGPHNVIHPIIRIKHTRLSPKIGEYDHGLMPTPNELKDQKRSSLSPTKIHHIAKIARTLEEGFAHPVDIEFVVLNDDIFLVQVRPIVEAENKPSYLTEDFVKRINAENQVAMTPIVSGGGEAKHITANDQIIVAERIGKALDIYLDMKKSDQEKILLVISGENAPQTSHEATTFRSNAKPVMYVRDIAKAQAIIASEQYRLADVQRGKLYLAESFSENRDLKSGWLKHPIAEMVSVHPEFLPPLFLAYRHDDSKFADVSIMGLLDIARHGVDFAQAKSAIYTLRERLLARINAEEARQKELTDAKAETNPSLLVQLRTLDHHIKHSSSEVLRSLETYFAGKAEKSDMDELLRLYPINFLEALISQVPKDPDVVLPYSFGYLLKTEREESQLVRALQQVAKDDRGYVVQYARVGQYALTDEAMTAWGNFLTRFDQVSKKQDFARMMVTLAKLDILPVWLNMIFYPASVENNDPHVLSQKLINILDDEQRLLAQVFRLQQSMRQFPLNQLVYAKKFQKTIASWQEQVVNQTLDRTFLEDISKGSAMAKLVGLSALNYFVSKFDEGIKSLTGSQEYSSAIDKAKNFGAALDQYFSVLEIFSRVLLNDSESRSLLARPDVVRGVDNYMTVALPQGIASYLERMKTLMEGRLKHATTTEENARKTFLPSANFSVNAAKLGSEARWELVVAPHSTTLEDLFSLIHQNLLVILAKASAGLPWQSLPMPHLVQTLKVAMEGAEVKDQQKMLPPPAFIGATLNKDALTLYFNQTLRSHSNTFEIVYNLTNRSTTLRTQFIGQVQQRWHYFALLVKDILPISADLQTESAPFVDVKRFLLTFSWHIKNENQAKNAAKMWAFLGKLSNTMSTKLNTNDIVQFFDAVKADLDAEKIGILCKKVLSPWEIGDVTHASMMEVLVEKFPDHCRAAIAGGDAIQHTIKMVEGLVTKERLDDALSVVYASSFGLEAGTSLINFLDEKSRKTLTSYIKKILKGESKLSKDYLSSITQKGRIMADIILRSKSLLNMLLERIDVKYAIKENITSSLAEFVSKAMATPIGQALNENNIDDFIHRFIGNPLPKSEDRLRDFTAISYFMRGILNSNNQRLISSLKRILIASPFHNDSLTFMITFFRLHKHSFDDPFNETLVELIVSNQDKIPERDLKDFMEIIDTILNESETAYSDKNLENLIKFKTFLKEKKKKLMKKEEEEDEATYL